MRVFVSPGIQNDSNDCFPPLLLLVGHNKFSPCACAQCTSWVVNSVASADLEEHRHSPCPTQLPPPGSSLVVVVEVPIKWQPSKVSMFHIGVLIIRIVVPPPGLQQDMKTGMTPRWLRLGQQHSHSWAVNRAGDDDYTSFRL